MAEEGQGFEASCFKNWSEKF